MMMQRLRGLAGLLRASWDAYQHDNAQYFAAAMIYYALLSLVPLLLLLLAALGLLLRYSEVAIIAQLQVLQSVETALGSEARAAIEQVLVNLQQQSIVVITISLIVLVVQASLLFWHLRRCFGAIWNAAPLFAEAPVRVMVRRTLTERLLAFAMILTCGLLLLLFVVVTTVIQWLSGVLGAFPLLGGPTDLLITSSSGLALGTLIFALLFKYLPPVRIRWRDVGLSALLCALTWEIASMLMNLYVLFFGASGSAYGALSTVLVVMLWMNMMGQVFFLGAELCKVVAQRNGDVTSSDLAPQS